MLGKILMVVCFIGMFAVPGYAEDQTPGPGKQVPQKITVPKSTSIWESGKKESQLNPENQKSSLERIVQLLGEIRPVDQSGSEEMQYYIYLPKDYDAKAEKKWPLLLFLHGAGERGDNIETVAVHGPPKMIAKNDEMAQKFPFIVISPQCRNDRYWSVGQLQLLLDEIEKNYLVDKDRIYVTGLSMGGFGSWMLAFDTPERFAAVAPICGGFFPDKAKELISVPIWAFHGDVDGLVPVALTKNMIEAIKDAGGEKAKMTIYPGVNHNSWTQTYNNEELYKWFLSKKRVTKAN